MSTMGSSSSPRSTSRARSRVAADAGGRAGPDMVPSVGCNHMAGAVEIDAGQPAWCRRAGARLGHVLGPGRRVVIGYDARHKSDLFATDSAAVLAGAGLRALL